MSTANLYKYRKFGANTLELITTSEVFYADPASFNDPLDSKIAINADIPEDKLEEIFKHYLSVYFPKKSARKFIEEFKYYASEYDYLSEAEIQIEYIRILTARIINFLEKDLGKRGVFSLGRSWDCPLMWSHYGDHHKGICLGYDAAKAKWSEFHEVSYAGPRSINASDIYAAKINKNEESIKKIERVIYFTKAPNWNYEKEWRDVREQVGRHDPCLKISEIYFGLRCSDAVQSSVMQLFYGRKLDVSFYKIAFHENTFDLIRHEINPDEVNAFVFRFSGLDLASLDW